MRWTMQSRRVLVLVLATAAAGIAAPVTVESERNSSSVRILRGPFGKFSGADFPCEAHKNIYRNEIWARGACMIRCAQRACRKATKLCATLPECTTVNINVEGTVATLKRETDVSRTTSGLKQLTFSQVSHFGKHTLPGPSSAQPVNAVRDRACAESNVRLQSMDYLGAYCLLDCPKLDCTRATYLCYQSEGCTHIQIGIGIRGHMGVARLLFLNPGALVSHS